jgi:hypothetical protein
VDDDPQRPSRAHGDGGLDVEVALHQPLSGAVGRELGSLLERLDEVVVARPEGELAADAEHGGERHPFQQLPGVEIDLVGEAGVAAGVGGRQVVDHDGGAVGQDDALPDDEGALLPEGDDVVVLADQPGALGDQQEPSRDRVVDVRRAW